MGSRDREFQNLIRQLQIRFTRFYARFLSRHDLTFPQFALVSLAYHEGDAPMNAFAKRLMISLPAVTHLVDRLEREKFIRRIPHGYDRRVTLIRITEKGRKAVAETQGRIQKLFLNLLLQFPKRDRETIQNFYAKFSAQLEYELRGELAGKGRKK